MSLYDILDWLWYGFMIVIVWPILTGLIVWRQLDRRERSLIAFLLSLLTGEIIATILRFSMMRNHFMHYVATLAVLGLILFFYANSGRSRWIVTSIVVAITVSIPIEVFVWTGFNQINTVTETLAWLLLTSLAFINLKHLLDSSAEVSLRKNPFVYYHTGFFILGFFRAGKSCFVRYFIETSLDLYFFMDTLVVIMGAVAYSLFALGILYRQRLSVSSNAVV
ncbi:hypothetical protein [Spirosoma validum]|uniref:Uncharacterized protein n=1 Tax=Spirosoma validum TaxID=2771355 RepID=A0A927B508_9BACT|nr:hypothetical protein [Spirosoma validum]MBD2755357.1 hypothetical protein [Spirosoma validum]